MQTPKPRRAVLALALAALALSGCGWFDEEERLEGERVRIRAEAPDPVSEGGLGTVPGSLTLPAPRPISEWTHVNAVPSHNAGHLAGPASLSRIWTADAGEGDSSRSRITAAPIVAGGTVFTLDAAARLSAFSASSGSLRWRTDLSPETENGSEGFGGGLSFDAGRVFVATGFGEVLGIDPGSGEIVWRTSVGAPFRAAPAAGGGVVVAVTRDNRAFGFDQRTGEIVWRAAGATSDAGFLGGASPALAQGIALLPFPSGELVAVEARTGRRAWTAVLGGGRRGLARASISDVTGDPVVVGPLVVAANQSGRIVGIEGATGRRVWTRSIGSAGPLWAAGDSLFVVSDASELLRLSATSGTTLWAVQLPAYEDPEDREGPITYSGPVLVEGRILVTSSEGEILAFDGVTGQEVTRTPLGGGSVTGPVVADGILFVLNDEGTLEAFR